MVNLTYQNNNKEDVAQPNISQGKCIKSPVKNTNAPPPSGKNKTSLFPHRIICSKHLALVNALSGFLT